MLPCSSRMSPFLSPTCHTDTLHTHGQLSCLTVNFTFIASAKYLQALVRGHSATQGHLTVRGIYQYESQRKIILPFRPALVGYGFPARPPMPDPSDNFHLKLVGPVAQWNLSACPSFMLGFSEIT